jgi:hypothetical protein
MTRQKSENREVPQGRRKPVETQGVERVEGGKAIPVKERPRQLGLRFETAEEFAQADTDGGTVSHRRRTGPLAAPKSKSKEKEVLAATLEQVTASV